MVFNVGYSLMTVSYFVEPKDNYIASIHGCSVPITNAPLLLIDIGPVFNIFFISFATCTPYVDSKLA